MLFLSITLSFFVENHREHYIEHQPHHGPVFIKSPTEETLDQLYTNALYEAREFKRHIFIMQRHETAVLSDTSAIKKQFRRHIQVRQFKSSNSINHVMLMNILWNHTK
jgi:hypothetical protein